MTRPRLAILALRQRLQVGAGTEGAPGTGEDGNARLGVGVERAEGLRDGGGRFIVHGIADVRPIDGDDRDRTVLFDQDLVRLWRSHGMPFPIVSPFWGRARARPGGA